MARAKGGIGLRASASAVAASAPMRYFERLDEQFQASAEVELHEREITAAGRRVRLRFADRRILEAFYPALSHLEVRPGRVPDVEFCLWDACGRDMPEVIWGDQPPAEDAVVRHLCDENVSTKLDARSTAVSCYDRSCGRLLYCTRDVARTLWDVRSSPLVTEFGWALATHSRALVHAGCVGRDGRGVLVAGPSGAGKSSTCVGSALAGLEYVSDDYVLVEAGADPVAHSLTCMGRIHRSGMRRIGDLDGAVAGWIAEDDPKAVIDIRRLAPDRIRTCMRIKALVLPRVTPGTATATRRVGAAEALRVMAPSSLFNLPPEDPRGAFAAMGSLTRALPAYVLDLGGDATAAAAEVARLCDDG